MIVLLSVAFGAVAVCLLLAVEITANYKTRGANRYLTPQELYKQKHKL